MNPSLKLLNRHSTPAKMLTEPAPDKDQLAEILGIALTAPDHKRLRPYRFISISGEARNKLSKVFGDAAKQRDPEITDDYLKKQQAKPLHAPLIIVVVACLTEQPKVPEIEQMLSAGAAAHNILLASNALGFGSVWLTGANAFDPVVRTALQVKDQERIIGFLYLGTAKTELPDPTPIEVGPYLHEWG